MSAIEIFAIYISMISFWHVTKGLESKKGFRESYLKQLVFLYSE
jgi:hypothetical protein